MPIFPIHCILSSMDSCYAALVPDRESARLLRQAQKRHYERTGDSSVYALPPLVLLGTVPSPGSIPRGTVRLDVTFTSHRLAEGPLGWVLTDPAILSTAASLRAGGGPAGLYFSRLRPDECACESIHCSRFRLASLCQDECGFWKLLQ